MGKINFILLLVLALPAHAERKPKVEFRHQCPAPEEAKGKLLIHHIDVGQGDSTFIRTPEGLTLLIDGGVPSRGRMEILPLLQDCYGIRPGRGNGIDYVLLTHFDLDHQGGLTEVLGKLEVKKAVYDPGDELNGKNPDPKSVNGKYVAAAKKSGVRKIPEIGAGSFQLPKKDKTKIEVVSLGGRAGEDLAVDLIREDGRLIDDNAVSISLVIRLGDFDYFIGGDLTGGGDGTPDVESLVAGIVGDVDVLHANHHGSKTSNNERFLNALRPEYVVISVGDAGMNRKYKLPSAEVMERMQGMEFIRTVFQTARGESTAREAFLKKVKNEQGDVVILAEPDRFSVNGKEFAVDEAERERQRR